MGYQDWFRHGYDFLEYWIESIYYLLYPRLEQWAQWIDSKIIQAHDILWHNWQEVKDMAITAAAAAYDLMLPKIEEVKDYAMNRAAIALETADMHLNTVENSLRRVTSNLDNKIDTTKRILLASMDNMESVAGSARVLLQRTLESAIDSVERQAKDARSSLEYNFNRAVNALEREAKEAREVLEGNLIYALELLEDTVRDSLKGIEKKFDKLLTSLTGRVGGLEDWVGKAVKWFDAEFNKYQERVVGWIVDRFEDILDRVFR